jgi:hypothetical protein
MKFWHFILGVFLAFVVLIALLRKYGETPAQHNARMEKVYQAHPDLRPAPVVVDAPKVGSKEWLNTPKPEPLTHEQQHELDKINSNRMMPNSQKCALVHDLLKDRKISSLTVSESEALQGCRLLGL